MRTSSKTSDWRGFAVPWMDWLPITWMAASFAVAAVLAVAMLSRFGLGERGTAIALQLTARWSFLLFWLAYIGSALVKVLGPRFNGLARHGREFGLAYASAQVVHVGLVLWIFYLAPKQNGGMYFFWIGIACTYFLALFSVPSFCEKLGSRLWRVFRTAALEYIALVFATDFVLNSLEAPVKHELLGYVPFVTLLVGAVGLRVASVARYWGPQKACRGYDHMSKIIAIGVGVMLFGSIGFGLWDLVYGLAPLALSIALTFVAAGMLNTWGALNSN